MTPVSYRTAWLIVAVCAATVLAVVVLLLAAPRAAAEPFSEEWAHARSRTGEMDRRQLSGLGVAPSGEVGTALIGGWATYWDTCDRCAAAGPLLQSALGPRWKGQTVTVESDRGFVELRLVTSCACGDRTRNGETRPTIIDVSEASFRVLSGIQPGSSNDPGYVAVSIEIGGPAPTLPATDTPDQHPEDPPEHPDDARMRLEVRDLPRTDTRETP